jgi:hypothetical protein
MVFFFHREEPKFITKSMQKISNVNFSVESVIYIYILTSTLWAGCLNILTNITREVIDTNSYESRNTTVLMFQENFLTKIFNEISLAVGRCDGSLA